MGIGKRLKEARLGKGFTQAELAKKIGVTYGAIGNYENETSHPRDTILYSIMKELGVDANFLFQDEIEKIYPSTLTPTGQRIGRAYEKATPPVQRTVEVALEPYMSESTPDTVEPAEILPGTVESAPDEESQTLELPVYDEPAAAGLGNYLEGNHFEMQAFDKNSIPRKADICVKLSGNSMEPVYIDGCIVYVETCPAIESGQTGIFIYDGKAYCKKLIIDRAKKQIRLESLNTRYPPIIIKNPAELRTVGRVLGVAKMPEMVRVYRAARSTNNAEGGHVEMSKDTLNRLKSAKESDEI